MCKRKGKQIRVSTIASLKNRSPTFEPDIKHYRIVFISIERKFSIIYIRASWNLHFITKKKNRRISVENFPNELGPFGWKTSYFEFELVAIAETNKSILPVYIWKLEETAFRLRWRCFYSQEPQLFTRFHVKE